MKSVSGEIVEPEVHEFWLATTGYDTWWKGANHAQRETPWNRYSHDGKTLVNTMWQDRIVTVLDDEISRRFVLLGGKRKSWVKLSVTHGKEADTNLHRAIAARHTVIGYETVGDPKRLIKGERRVKHFCMERAYELRPVIGTRGDDLKSRLKLNDVFKAKGVIEDDYIGAAPWTFELLPLQSLPPHLVRAPFADPPIDDDFNEDGEEVEGAEEESLSISEAYAKKALPVLVKHVLAQRDGVMKRLTYKELAEQIDRRTYRGEPWARGMGRILNIVTGWIDDIQQNWNDDIPYLTSIVVKSTVDHKPGLPGDGISAKFPDYASLSDDRKEAVVSFEYGRILNFGAQWHEVLRQLGIKLPATTTDDPGLPSNTSGGGWGGGESEAHKALKKYVAEHPESFGVAPGAKATEEYPLHSRDVIDVFFETPDEWVGIEVKSRVSDGDVLDYRRGIYQVVKYRSLLEAQAKVEHPEKAIVVKVFLVLEKHMPKIFKDLPGILDVQIYENVRPMA